MTWFEKVLFYVLVLCVMIMMAVMCFALPCPEPNEQCLQALVDNWLKVNPVVTKQVCTDDHSDPNGVKLFNFNIKTWQFNPLSIMDIQPEPDGVVNLPDFAVLSACWVPSATTPVSKPNTNETLGVICYTVGGKDHLYSDCRYIVYKPWVPCLCGQAGKDPNVVEPNDICIACAARALKERK